MKMSLFKDIVLGIDIGGTTCKCGVFTTDGTLVYKDEIPTRKDEGGSLILSDIKEHIPELMKLKLAMMPIWRHLVNTGWEVRKHIQALY